MTLYFAWAEPNEAFNAAAHAREDAKILRLEIRQNEGGFAVAKLWIGAKQRGQLQNPPYPVMMIASSQEGEVSLLFRGRILGSPVTINDDVLCFCLTAEPENSSEKLHSLHQQLKQSNLWNDLFVDEEGQNDPLESLEARSDLFHWSRITGDVSLSNIFEGNQQLNIDGNFFQDSLKMKVTGTPLRSISVKLIAEWVQQYDRTYDISHVLSHDIPGGLLSSFTGPDLAKKWWQQGERVGYSSYWVGQTELQSVKTVVGHPTYPVMSPRLSAPGKYTETGDLLASDRTLRLKRFWFKPQMEIDWKYRQRRREVVSFTLENNAKEILPTNRQQRNLTLRLQNIVGENHTWRPNHRYRPAFRVVYQGNVYRCIQIHQSGENFDEDKWQRVERTGHVSDQAQLGTFFLHNKGRECVEHAIEIAKCHLAASSRVFKVSVRTAFEVAQGISLDHSVRLRDQRLPGGEITGKVSSYRLFVDGDTGNKFAELSIIASVGRQPLQVEDQGQGVSPYVSQGYGEEDLITSAAGSIRQTPSGIAYVDWSEQAPTKGIVYPQSLTTFDLVRRVRVHNSADEQLEKLLEDQQDDSVDPLKVLNEFKTNVQVQLMDASSVETLTHTIHVRFPTPWTPPEQVNLP